MKFDLTRAAGQNAITAYGDGYVMVNGARHDKNLILLADRILEWNIESFEALGVADFERLAELDPEVVLLGTGARLRFPPVQLTRPLIEARRGLEVMDMQAACRTFNILVSEGRRVVAALLLR
ncbi:MAG TPA: Mth938-like domain-containing protein [Burkholderiales bacterium]|nr:Mth938-like domain-containing protein [Burkholderiales bacterium]